MKALLEGCASIDIRHDLVQIRILTGTGKVPVTVHNEFSVLQYNLQAMISWRYDHECYRLVMEGPGVY